MEIIWLYINIIIFWVSEILTQNVRPLNVVYHNLMQFNKKFQMSPNNIPLFRSKI